MVERNIGGPGFYEQDGRQIFNEGAMEIYQNSLTSTQRKEIDAEVEKLSKRGEWAEASKVFQMMVARHYKTNQEKLKSKNVQESKIKREKNAKPRGKTSLKRGFDLREKVK